jgi:hypothetical protein
MCATVLTQAVAKSQEYARIVADVAIYRVELRVVGRSKIVTISEKSEPEVR